MDSRLIEPLPDSLVEYQKYWSALLVLMPADYDLLDFWGNPADSSLDLVAELLAINSYYAYTLADVETRKNLIKNYNKIYSNLSTPKMVIELLKLFNFSNAQLIENTSPFYYDIALFSSALDPALLTNIRRLLESHMVVRNKLGSLTDTPPQYIDGTFNFNGSRYLNGSTTPV